MVNGYEVPEFQWSLQNPIPTINHVSTVKVIDDSTAFIGSDLGMAGGGTLFITRDRGKTWDKVNTSSLDGVKSIQKLSSKRVWVRQGKTIFRSDDVGQTWIEIKGKTKTTDLQLQNGTNFIWLDSLTGWSDNGKCKTIDGGLTWNYVNGTKYQYGNHVYELNYKDIGFSHYFTNNFGIILSRKSPLSHYFKTDNGGDSCYAIPVIESKTFDTLSLKLNGKFCITNDSRFCWFIDSYKSLFSDDSAKTWQVISGLSDVFDGKSFNVYDVDFIDSANGWVLGPDSNFAHTTDGGKTWKKQSSGNDWPKNSKLSFKQMDFSPNYSWGVAVGGKGFITNSIDSGKTWKTLTKGDHSNWNAVFAIDSSIVLVGGYSNYLYKTKNGGENWKSIKIDKDTTTVVTDIHFHDKSNGIACGYNGKIWRTSNGGNNWKIITTGNNSRFVKMKFVNELQGWITGEDSKVYYTKNGGKTWKVQVVDTAQSNLVISVDFIDSLTGIVGDDHGYAYQTNDGGKSWKNVLICKNRSPLIETSFAGNGYWFISRAGTPRLYKSSDNGKNWENVYYGPILRTLNKIIPVDSTTLFAATENGVVYTDNGGIEWKSITENQNEQINLLDLTIKENFLWGVGNFGSIIKFYSDLKK